MASVGFQQRFADGVTADALAAFQTDLEQHLSQMINEKHATLLIPRVTIDPTTVTFAANSTGFTALNLATSTSISSPTFVTVLSYTGRGILRMLIAGQMGAAGALARTAGIRITVDGNVVYSDSSGLITTQLQAKVIVGQLPSWTSASAFEVIDDPIGLPFNQSLLIEGLISSGDNLTAGWRLSKKL